MFGFDDIAGFTHNLETAFDRLRNGQLAATADLINLTLAAGDQIKTMLDGAAGRGTVDLARSSEILAKLHQLTGSSGPPPDTTPSPAPQDSPASGLAHEWRIRFRPGPNVILNGTNPLLLLRELRELGGLRIELDTAAVPPLARDRRGTLLSGLGYGLDHGRCARGDPRYLHLRRRRLRTRHRARHGPGGGRRHTAGRVCRTERAGLAPRGRSGERVEHSSVGRQAGPAGQPGGRTGHGAGATERGRRPPRRRRHCRDIRGGRPADGGAAGKLDEHPHAAPQNHLRAVPAPGSRSRNRAS